MSLSWTPAPVSGAPVTRYRYRRSDDGGSTWTRWSTVWFRLSGYPVEPLFYQVQRLTNDVEYTFELRAIKADGQVVGEASATATPTATPGADIRLLSVSYGTNSYQATEGDSVSVQVRLSPSADRQVDIPITVTRDSAEPGDYRVSGLSPEDTVSFAQSSSSETFHIVANPDMDTDDDTVILGFGTLPSGVLTGSTSSTTVTLVDTTGTSGPLTISGPASVCYDKDRTDAVASYEARDAQATPVSSAAWTLSGVDAGAFGVNAGVLRFDPGPSFENPTDDGADNVYDVSLRAGEGARRSDLFPVAVSVVNADDGVLTLSPDPPVAGRTVLATLADLDGGATNFRWRWTKSPASSEARYSLVADSYTPVTSDVGKTLTVTVTYDDRCSSGNTVSVTSQAVESPPANTPDLVVGSPSVTDSRPAAGASFTLSATVRNQGSGTSAATTLRYYRSANPTIASGDTQVGTDAVSALAASGTSAESIPLTAPAASGTYYYGACVVAVSGETNTGNNCSSAVTVTVGEEPPPSSPDLVVGAPSVTDSSPAPGASFTLRATVRNQGTGSSAATTLRYYRSTNTTISTSDTQVGTDPVSALAASATSAESIRLTAPSTEGTYYYGACVVAVAGEANTGNNCSSAVTVTVGEEPPPSSPDLVVGAPSVTDSSPAPGASFTLSTTVRNQGGGSSVATTLRYYRSTDGTIATGDTQVGTDAVSALAASGTSAESIRLTAPATEGTYYYGACVVAVSGEANTGNNCSSAVTVTVGDQPPPSSPDLVVGAPSVTDSRPPRGGSFTLSATVRNQGTGSSATTTLRYYRSTDGTIATSDTQVGTDVVGALAASATSAKSIGLTAPSEEGTYYYGACVDAVSDESDTGNNCSGAVEVTVVNGDPVITSASAASVPEGTSGVVYTGTATDPDGDTVTWSKRDHDHADFNLNSSSGALSFRTAPDHEKPHDGDTNSKYKVTIVATDPAGAYDTQLVTITVDDVDGTPTVTGPASITKAEKSAKKVADYTVSDPDPSETFTWSLEGTYAAAFFEHQAGSHVKERELHFQRTPDYETRVSYTLYGGREGDQFGGPLGHAERDHHPRERRRRRHRDCVSVDARGRGDGDRDPDRRRWRRRDRSGQRGPRLDLDPCRRPARGSLPLHPDRDLHPDGR